MRSTSVLSLLVLVCSVALLPACPDDIPQGEGEGEAAEGEGDAGEGEGEGDVAEGEGEGEGEPPVNTAFFDLLDQLDATPAADRQALVDDFLATHDAPYTEGDIATWLFQGDPTSDVQLAGDLTGWDFQPEPMDNVPGTDLFHVSYRLPDDARIDYKFIVDGEWLLDPKNPHLVPSGFGDNSELRMPQWQYPTLIDFNAAIAHGAVNGQTVSAAEGYPAETLHSDVLNNDRNVFVYTPPGYDPAHVYPLLVVNDGGEYVFLAKMPNVLDALIAQGAIEPLVVAFVSPVDRNQEYVGNQVSGYVQLITTELLPFVEARASVATTAARRGVMGTSYGGYISMRLAHDHPEVFGMFGAQSGILEYDGGAVLQDFVAGGALGGVRAWLDVGTIGDALDDSQAAHDLFTAEGIDHGYLEVNEGHSWGSWRARLDELLTQLFGV